MRNVLLVTPHFPPDSSAATHRIRLLAPHLPAHGWRPTVLTVDASAYEGALDPDLLALVPPELDVVRAPAWPVSLTRLAGIGDLGVRALSGLRARASALLATGRFSAFLITTYPIYPACLGPALRRRYQVPFVLDVQDPWVGAWGRDVGTGRGGGPDLKSRLSRWLAMGLERRILPHVDGVTAVSARTYEDMLARVPRVNPPVCAELPLGFEPADLAHLRAHPRPVRLFDPADGLVHLVSVGTILPTGRPVVDTFLAGWRRLCDREPALGARIRWHVVGSGNQRQPGQRPRVWPRAAAYGLEAQVDEHPERVDYLDALTLQLRAHGIVLLGSPEPHYTPSKAYPAFLTGRPLLGVYHEASSVVPFLQRADGARVLAVTDRVDPEALAGEMARALAEVVAMAGAPDCVRDPADVTAWSAADVARRLATVFDRVAGERTR